MTRVWRLMVCVAVVGGLMVSSAPPAHAHYGDWWTQRQRTERECGSNCRYDYSGTYGEHSRLFFYTKFYGWDYCYKEYAIGHSYYIFSARTTYCTNWHYA